MYDSLRRCALAALKTPPEPQPPFGNPASLRVFRAGRNYFRLRMAGWAAAQVMALAALIFWTAFLIGVEQAAREQGEARAKKRAATAAAASAQPGTAEAGLADERPASAAGAKARKETWKSRLKERVRQAASDQEAAGKDSKKVRAVKTSWAGFQQACVEVALILPAGTFVFIWALKIFSGLIYLVQIPLTYAIRRLDYEMRWYMVTDRSLRLRHGVWKVSESTMSFANIQQVVVSQGPVQRLLGMADVKVKSAGGGGQAGGHHSGESDMHLGLFHSVTNAQEIRDLIIERLRRFREAGLGDPDEKQVTSAPASARSDAFSPDALAAARELAAEARALNAALTPHRAVSDI